MSYIVRKNGSGKLGKHLYLVKAPIGALDRYDTYSEFLACADSEDDARKMHPDGALDENDIGYNWPRYEELYEYDHGSWVSYKDIDKLNVKYLGDAVNIVKGVIMASYHAG